MYKINPCTTFVLRSFEFTLSKKGYNIIKMRSWYKKKKIRSILWNALFFNDEYFDIIFPLFEFLLFLFRGIDIHVCVTIDLERCCK